MVNSKGREKTSKNRIDRKTSKSKILKNITIHGWTRIDADGRG